MVRLERLELPTFGSANRRSDPDELQPLKMVRVEGFQPPISSSQARHAEQAALIPDNEGIFNNEIPY